MTTKKKLLWSVLAILLLFGALNLSNNKTGADKNPLKNSESHQNTEKSDTFKSNSPHWSDPVSLAVNTEAWEDGAFISGDGKTLYYAKYPGKDLINDLKHNRIKGDIDLYYSEYPFVESKKHPLSESIWSEGGMMLVGDDIYYHSNKPIDARDKKYDTNIYKNNQLLSFNSDLEQDDPHYCAAEKELYFWSKGKIFIFKDDKITKLPEPVNAGKEDIQPFLSPDCQEIYFSSRRDQDEVLKIYKAARKGEFSWNQPELVIESEFGVGEPTLTEDGKKLFFVRVSKSENNEFSSDIFYLERVE